MSCRSQELTLIVPSEQKNDGRIQGLAKNLEKQFFEKANSKASFYLN
jgi:hypothetical protein